MAMMPACVLRSVMSIPSACKRLMVQRSPSRAASSSQVSQVLHADDQLQGRPGETGVLVVERKSACSKVVGEYSNETRRTEGTGRKEEIEKVD
jgi:hypothetical protein